MHLLFNMLGLVMMGGLESMLGMRKFAITLFGGVLVGGLAHIATVPVIPCVGLSAGLMALLAYYCLLFPSTKVLLFFVLPVKSIYFYYGSIAYSLVAWQFNLQQGVGHTAHLGGMLIGTLIFLQYKRSVRSIATLMPEVMSRDELAEELRDAYGHDV
jgi:membrane associated rhomboid family serine protease